MSARILILGAGPYQIPLIGAARTRGMHVIAASYRATDPGMARANESWVIDTTDGLALLARARASGLDAIATTGTDVALPSLALLATELGLRGVSPVAARNSTNKGDMQRAFRRAGVAAARSLEAESLARAREAATQLGYPVIVKAPDSSGSRGCSAVYSDEALPEAYAAAEAVRRQGPILVEQLLVGTEFGAQLVVQKGHLERAFFHDDVVTDPPVSVPIGHSMPCVLSSEILVQAHTVCERAIAALGIADAVCNADLMATPEGVHVLEIGARAGATGLPELIQHHCGIDLYHCILDLALGEPAQLIALPSERAAAVRLLVSPATGVLVEQRLAPHHLANPGLREVRWDYQPGAPVRAFRVGPDRIGDVFTVGSSPAQASELAACIARDLVLRVRNASE